MTATQGGITVGPCTTTATVVSLSLTNSGAGYTPGTAFTLTFTGLWTSPPTGTFDVNAGGHVTNLQLTFGGTGLDPFSGVTIGFTGAGSPTTLATATATFKAECCLSLPTSGSWTITAQVPGTSQSVVLTVGCGTNTSQTFTFANLVPYSITFLRAGNLCSGGTPCESGTWPVTVSATDGITGLPVSFVTSTSLNNSPSAVWATPTFWGLINTTVTATMVHNGLTESGTVTLPGTSSCAPFGVIGFCGSCSADVQVSYAGGGGACSGGPACGATYTLTDLTTGVVLATGTTGSSVGFCGGVARDCPNYGFDIKVGDVLQLSATYLGHSATTTVTAGCGVNGIAVAIAIGPTQIPTPFPC